MPFTMKRREFLAATAAAFMPRSSFAATRPPNIVFILADDLGYGDLGCYGQRRIQTPNIDRLAEEGTRFTQAYAGATVCAPSRCALMTGKHGGHATVRGNVKPELGLRPDEPTVASLLKDAGYRTALFGKWGLGGPGMKSMPTSKGFDEFYGFLDQQHAHNSFPEHLWDGENEVFLTTNWFDGRKDFVGDLFARKALDFIARRKRDPFFLYFASTAPHADNERGSRFKMGIDVPSDEPYSKEAWPEVERNFAALVTRLDSDVGRIMAALKQAGVDDNTLVIFTSDNGPHREGVHDTEFFHSRGPLRGIKRDLYEGGIRVPFLARWPVHVRAGRASDQVLAFWDMLPTFTELAGARTPSGLDGVSMAAALAEGKPVHHAPLYWEFHENRFSQAVRFDDWKAVRNNVGQPIELYDLTHDLGEANNVAAAHPDLVRQAGELMRTLRVDSPAFPVRSGARK
jgi:arylsulfatase A-like enzyme